MARKQRVETYLDPEDADRLDELEEPISQFVREATLKELDRRQSAEASQ